MIDFFDIKISFRLDPKAYRSFKTWGKSEPPPSRHRQDLGAPGWLTKARVIVEQDHFRIRACPAKILGSWNAFGSSNLREMVTLVVPLVLQELGHRTTDEQLKSIEDGDYKVQEVHVAKSFLLPDYCQREFVRKLHFALAHRYPVEKALRGDGLVIKPRNRRVYYYLYVKYLEVIGRGFRAYEKLVECSPSDMPWIYLSRNAHLLYSAYGPRFEIRFGDQFFRNNVLASGSEWDSDTADTLYFEHLSRLDLPSEIGLTFQRDHAQSLLSGPEFRALLLWKHGETVESLGSASTRQRLRHAILDALDIDIAHPAASLLNWAKPLDVRTVLCAENVVPPIPDWDDANAQDLVYRLLVKECA